jgi:hypothetical protein
LKALLITSEERVIENPQQKTSTSEIIRCKHLPNYMLNSKLLSNYKISMNKTNIGIKLKKQMNKLKFYIIKSAFLQISVALRVALAAQAYPAQGMCLEE